MQQEQKESSYDVSGNASTSDEFGKIRRSFYWRNKLYKSNSSRRRVIAKANIISAFIATEEEVKLLRIRLIVILLERKGGTERYCTSAPLIETFTGKAYLNFLEGNGHRIFEFEKPA